MPLRETCPILVKLASSDTAAFVLSVAYHAVDHCIVLYGVFDWHFTVGGSELIRSKSSGRIGWIGFNVYPSFLAVYYRCRRWNQRCF
jgi:hypothetical protein